MRGVRASATLLAVGALALSAGPAQARAPS
ncbi:MAG: hypothetical protein QOF12_2330, partial [Solirubrobacteraceae bacterium]|nr:hypothetical protein [Solirubrobacteraceae bacterium]